MIPIPGTPYLLAAAFVAGAVCTYKVMDWKHDAELLQEARVATEMVRGGYKIVVKTEHVVQERIVAVKQKGDTIVREIPKVVTVEVERACPSGLPVGYVRLHDDAAANRTPGAASVADADPAGVTLAQASEAVTDNYTAYHTCREQVIGWNEFYRRLKALHDAADPSR